MSAYITNQNLSVSLIHCPGQIMLCTPLQKDDQEALEWRGLGFSFSQSY